MRQNLVKKNNICNQIFCRNFWQQKIATECSVTIFCSNVLAQNFVTKRSKFGRGVPDPKFSTYGQNSVLNFLRDCRLAIDKFGRYLVVNL